MKASPDHPMEIAPGILIEGIEGPAPVQVEGSIDGKRFYFRARFNAWSLSIHETATGEYQTWPDDDFWRHEEFYGESGYDASHMPDEDVLAAIIKAADAYRSQKAAETAI